jgi:biotin-(acetyl-CoA carboxylase) ligase
MAQTKTRVLAPKAPTLDLPPLFRAVPLREAGNAFAHAKVIAAKEGAGTIVWVRRFDLVEFAVVLEPDEPLNTARRTIYAGLAALADALASHAPPEKGIAFEWPAVIFVDGALIGGGELGWPENAAEEKRPDWLVFGAMVRMAALAPLEPGFNPKSSDLEAEGFQELGAGGLIETFARHLMVYVDLWLDRGFVEVAKAYLERLPAAEGYERAIDGIGDLLIRKKGKLEVEKKKLLPAIERARWRNPDTGEMLL